MLHATRVAIIQIIERYTQSLVTRRFKASPRFRVFRGVRARDKKAKPVYPRIRARARVTELNFSQTISPA